MKFALALTLLFSSIHAQADTCPSWVKNYQQTDFVQCTELDSTQTFQLLGSGVISGDEKHGMNFKCETENCQQLAIVFVDHENQKIYQLNKMVVIPIAKTLEDQNLMIELRLKTLLLGLTSSEMGIEAPKIRSGREWLANPSMNQDGWNWSVTPVRISNRKFNSLTDAMTMPKAMRWDRYCSNVSKMSKIANLDASATDAGTTWLKHGIKECRRTGF
jgi:hypothetical protein